MSRISLLLVGLLMVGFNSIANACDTPVYRYAMYKWESSPYEVYFFHDADLSEADLKVSHALEEIESRLAPRSNVVYIPIDLRKPDALKRVPADVRRRWDEREEKTAPAYLTVSPLGGFVSWETLTADSVAALVDSPVRKQIAKELADAKAGALVLLTGKNPLANQVAEKELQLLAKQLAAGEIPLYRPPTDPLAGGTPGEPVDDALDIAVVTIDRNDPAEQWFVNSLLAVEGDLREIETPMVFPVYGRGRVLPPYVGAGITSTNLADAIAFITGACSCTVKDQNPGVDLLMTYDWAAAADAMKEKFGNEEGNEEFGGADLFPQLIIPGETGTKPTPTDSAAVEPADSQVAQQPIAELGHSETDGAHGHADHSAIAMNSAHSLATDHDADAGESTALQTAPDTMFVTLAVGVGLGILLLAVGTFFVFRNEP